MIKNRKINQGKMLSAGFEPSTTFAPNLVANPRENFVTATLPRPTAVLKGESLIYYKDK